MAGEVGRILTNLIFKVIPYALDGSSTCIHLLKKFSGLLSTYDQNNLQLQRNFSEPVDECQDMGVAESQLSIAADVNPL